MYRFIVMAATFTLSACGGGGGAGGNDAGSPALPQDQDCRRIPIIRQIDADGICQIGDMGDKQAGTSCRIFMGTNWSCGKGAPVFIQDNSIPSLEDVDAGDDDI